MKLYYCYDAAEPEVGLYIAAETPGKAKKMYFDYDGMSYYTDIRARTDGYKRDITGPTIYHEPCPELERWGRRYCDEYGRQLDNFTGKPIEEAEE